MKEKVLVSACLCGVNCKYNGGNNFNEKIYNMYKNGDAFCICPERLGGLPTPRLPAEIRIINGKKHVFDISSNDVTDEFLKGAKKVVVLAHKLNIKKVITQPRSPSCGKGMIYDGTFSNKLTKGNGILVDMLEENKIEVISVDEI